MTSTAMAQRIELWPTARLVPYSRNARTHSDEQVAAIAASIATFGFNAPILVDSNAGIIAGHGRLLAARKLQLEQVPVVVLDHLTETQKRAYVLIDNKLADMAGWDEDVLKAELTALKDDIEFDVLGFTDEELLVLLDGVDESGNEGGNLAEQVATPPVDPVTRAGDLWLIGKHRVVCGSCRDRDVLSLLFDDDQAANVVITSPPYATQREYDPSSGFEPVAPEKYVEWYRAVAANIASLLAPDGSYFLNIKEHADEGERNLYVKDLVLAHRRQWGWRFVDEFCWRKTDNGVPGGWNNRFKNAWEPIFHFCRQQEIKFRPKDVGHVSEGCFDYSPETPKSNSGSGLLGDHDGRFTGIARPSNVIEVKSESSQGSHSAPFPRALAEFFIEAFSDSNDIIFDPFLGSGTTMAAAEVLGRIGYGVEISPAYCDVILRRMADLTGNEAVLAENGLSIAQVAADRGVAFEQVANPRLQDSRRIQHHGPAPFYGRRRRAS